MQGLEGIMFATLQLFDASGKLVEVFHERKDICLLHACMLFESNVVAYWEWRQ